MSSIRCIGLAVVIVSLCFCRKQEPVPVPAEEPAEAEAVVSVHTLTIVAAGDNLFHTPMIRRPYDFTAMYRAVKPLIEGADIGFINQETLLAGEAFGFSGYPRFNTPQEAGIAVIDAGFDVINHGNNHVMDKGEKAVFATMDFWDTYPAITYLGIRRSQAERDRPAIIEKNTIKVGFLSYTYGTNGLGTPKDKPYLVSLIDTAVMAKEIGALRPLCDYLVVSMHWGNEYQHTPTEQQKQLSAFLAEQKADLIIGHHPHVLQPPAVLPRDDGKETLCFYSLGNFISAQDMNATLLGGVLYVKLQKEGATLSVAAAGVIPVVTHYERYSTHFQVYPLYEYTEALGKTHWNADRRGLTTAYLDTLADTMLGSYRMNENPFLTEAETEIEKAETEIEKAEAETEIAEIEIEKAEKISPE